MRYQKINIGIERRYHSRAPVSWPVVLMTHQGAINCKTANVSASGLALILCPENPVTSDKFQITLKPSEEYEIPVTCEKIWSGSIIVDESVYSGIGVRFSKISSRDRKTIATLVAAYQ